MQSQHKNLKVHLIKKLAHIKKIQNHMQAFYFLWVINKKKQNKFHLKIVKNLNSIFLFITLGYLDLLFNLIPIQENNQKF